MFNDFVDALVKASPYAALVGVFVISMIAVNKSSFKELRLAHEEAGKRIDANYSSALATMQQNFDNTLNHMRATYEARKQK